MGDFEDLELASEYHRAGRLGEAEVVYRRVLASDPLNARAMQLMGVILHQRGDSEAAIEMIRKAIELNPGAADYYSNLGVLLYETGLWQEATQCYRKAIALNPNDPEVRWNYAINLLASGEFREGWEEFEWRLASQMRKLWRGLKEPQWRGEDLRGKTILLHAEGGFGDALQFVRYLPMVLGRGGRVILECQKELVRLFSGISGVSGIVARGSALPGFDYQIPLQGLPRVFGTRAENIPANIPYLGATEESVKYWREKLGAESGKKVGLCWAGSSTVMRSKSIEIFAPLAGTRGLRFYSLQKGAEGKQPRPAGLEMVDYMDEVRDFADTAGLIANLDLVISIDTSVAHLAGAMGKKVWTIIAFVPDFRWLREREDSPWYPTMKLFRQRKGEEWTGVVERVAAQLAGF